MLKICDVNFDLKDSKDEAQVTLRGRMIHSFGPVTAKDESYMDGAQAGEFRGRGGM